MGALIYFAIIGIQLTSTFVIGSVPLKCFLQNQSLLNIFGRSGDLSFPHVRFHSLKVNSITLDKDGWFFDTSNLDYQGLDDSIVDDFGFNLNSNVSQITFHTDLTASYLYKTTGSVFSTPISGEGPGLVSLKNIQFGFIMPFEFTIVNGQKFIELKGYDYWYDVRDNADFKLSNLHYGNQELSDSMHLLINQNWKYITEHFGKVFIDRIAEGIYNKFRSYTLAMPLKDFNTC